MARQLAENFGAHLVLVARRKDRLETLAKELESSAGVSVQVVAADLSRQEEVQRVFEEATAEHPLYAAVLNAGVTHFGHWDELSWEEYRRMLELNVLGTTQLTTLLLPYLEARSEAGGLLLVASMAGQTPLAYQTVYSASKAYLVHFGCGLWHEMQARGDVSVTTFAPGGIETEMTSGKRFNGLRSFLMPVEDCAREGLAAFERRAYLHVPGTLNRVGSALSRLLPQKLVIGQVAAQYRRSLEDER